MEPRETTAQIRERNIYTRLDSWAILLPLWECQDEVQKVGIRRGKREAGFQGKWGLREPRAPSRAILFALHPHQVAAEPQPLRFGLVQPCRLPCASRWIRRIWVMAGRFSAVMTVMKLILMLPTIPALNRICV
jgi:hypothetical protein